MKDPLCVAQICFPCIHIRCRHMNAVPPEGLSECNSLPLAMMNLLKSHSVQRRQNGKTKNRKKNLGSAHISKTFFAGLKSKHMGIKLGLWHLLFLGAILQYLLKTCRFSPRVPLDSLGELRFFRGLETHGSAVRWWWPLWQETSFVRWGVVRVRWWLGLRLGLKEFPQSPFVITKQFVAGRLRMIHGSQGFLVLPMVKVWSTWTSWGLIGVKALVIKKAEWVSWNPWCRATAQNCVIRFLLPQK